MKNLLKGMLLVGGAYSLLVWAYVSVRIISGINPFDEFWTGIPVSFAVLGLFSFITSAFCFITYAGVREL